jgi:hypothetical protein
VRHGGMLEAGESGSRGRSWRPGPSSRVIQRVRTGGLMGQEAATEELIHIAPAPTALASTPLKQSQSMCSWRTRGDARTRQGDPESLECPTGCREVWSASKASGSWTGRREGSRCARVSFQCMSTRARRPGGRRGAHRPVPGRDWCTIGGRLSARLDTGRRRGGSPRGRCGDVPDELSAGRRPRSTTECAWCCLVGVTAWGGGGAVCGIGERSASCCRGGRP